MPSLWQLSTWSPKASIATPQPGQNRFSSIKRQPHAHSGEEGPRARCQTGRSILGAHQRRDVSCAAQSGPARPGPESPDPGRPGRAAFLVVFTWESEEVFLPLNHETIRAKRFTRVVGVISSLPP